MNDRRPAFLPSFLELVKRESEQVGWRAVVPYVLLLLCLGAAISAYLIPDAFWDQDNWPVSTVVYTGILTFNGLIIALGWSAFGRIYDVLLTGEFGAYVAKHNLLNAYLTQITFMHVVQVLAVVASGTAIVTVLITGVPLLLARFVFGIVVALTAYAVRQAINAVSGMNDLVWQAAFYEIHKPDPKIRPMRNGLV
jgi:hypothetical protein